MCMSIWRYKNTFDLFVLKRLGICADLIPIVGGGIPQFPLVYYEAFLCRAEGGSFPDR